MAFIDRLQDTLDQGLKASKELFGKAREKAKDLGEIGVLKFEIKQLESQAEKLVAKLGSRVYDVLVKEEKNTVSQNTTGVKEIVHALIGIQNEIEQKEEQVKNVDKGE